MKITTIAAACLLLAATSAFAAAPAAEPTSASAPAAQPAQPSAEEKAYMAKMETLRASLKPQHGAIVIPKAKASLNLGDRYYFLAADDAKRVLTEGWGNPPGAADGVLGMVFPMGKTFIDTDVWGALITYEKTFYVSDDKARSEDYDSVFAEMKKGEEESNKQLVNDGYTPSVLLGWAQPPTYDATRHDLIWAREIKFGDQQDHTLNYDVRHLGREGVLSMNLISNMSQLEAIRGAAQSLAQTAEFNAGLRYADYKEGDKVAGYGLAGLVAAGAGLAVAKKAGLLAILILVLKKGGVFIIAGLGGGWAWLKSRIGAKKAKPKAVSATEAAPQDPLA
jgi:uncharacterized membrane-anchored protein